MAKITILSGPKKDKVYTVDQEAILGRSSDNVVPIHDTKTSRHHSRIFQEDNMYFIEDLGSRNGTIVNGKNITRQYLVSGDRIKIGNTLLVFVEDNDPAETMDISKLKDENKPESKPAKSKPKLSQVPSGKTRRIQAKRIKNETLLQKNFSQHPFGQKVLMVVIIICFMAVITWLSRWITLALLK